MHQNIVDAVLIAIFRIVIDFQEKQQIIFAEDDSYSQYARATEIHNQQDIGESSTDEDIGRTIVDKLDRVAEDLSTEFFDKFETIIVGVNSLDRLFGPDHNLLHFDEDSVDFGLEDGIWQHSGWEVFPSLQRELQSMKELRDMVKDLGRRPTADKSQGRLQKFVPRKLDSEGSMGARFDLYSRTSVSGLTLSSNLAQMLPSEAVMLRGSPTFRRLFMAKRIESKLLSYQLSDWVDMLSVPIENPKYLSRLPSGLGGPIIVCLDTSWSMSGRREALSKAVVLACVSAAHKQGRDCQVVAFSNERGVMDAGKISADSIGVTYLLDFLSNSFGGGTDVTGALKCAISSLWSNMSTADLLLVTDGEIPDPPVSKDIMEDLDRLKVRTGMEIHGLLVGNRHSKPLSKLCTHIHDFLINYETSNLVSRPLSSSTKSDFSLPASKLGRRGNYLSIFSSRLGSYGWQSIKNRGLKFPPSRVLCAKGNYEDENEIIGVKDETRDDYNTEVQHATETLRRSVIEIKEKNTWQNSALDDEKKTKESCWRYQSELKAAIERIGENLVERGGEARLLLLALLAEEHILFLGRIGENLVERGGEARLLLLALLAEEHILFLGPPGTAKSELGRRLSDLCGGFFFQRLLTRFTTPEEIFGPLSLSALGKLRASLGFGAYTPLMDSCNNTENDEYKRCTTGYLPTSSIAFLDEIFKANSAILNTLLTILNERQFDNGMGERDVCPIRCVVGASNELPESDELEALYDRFLLRKEVLPVSNEGVLQLLGMLNPGVSSCRAEIDDSNENCEVPFTDALDHVIKAINTAADGVTLREDTCVLIRDLRTFMKEELDVDVSDRRLTKAAHLLKVSAASHGRIFVDRIDCMLLQHLVWRLPEQHDAVREWLLDNITPCTSMDGSSSDAIQFRLILDSLRQEAIEAVRKTGGDVTGAGGARAAEVALIKALHNEVSTLSDTLKQRSDLLARHLELLNQSVDHLWLDQDESISIQQLLLPKARLVFYELNKVLDDSIALKLALSTNSGAPSDNVRLSVLELLQTDDEPEINFTEAELSIGMKAAKVKYDKATFRKWKKARKQAEKDNSQLYSPSVLAAIVSQGKTYIIPSLSQHE
eukprot:CAMPEP_0194228370 /NCGR_PEP_ID=MMETSP0156-20130528/43337_1 /TAXON_ID=33649 /ORGANISM="Thalassionema nitzschioides, Strain L26-B" /LENGTH=1110 /DNA_ID=CAMNT_0038960881 /DNA_START=537 /DNA_END=3871 /DNA_ORIENTATION=-